MKTRYLCLLSLLLSSLLLGTGCSVIHSHSTTKVMGKQVSDQTLARVEVGKTSKDWILATLGEPTASEIVDESTSILKYASKRIKSSNSTLLFVFDTSSKREEKRTIYFEFKDGILDRYWEETHSFSRR